jgi:hypothetical protein
LTKKLLINSIFKINSSIINSITFFIQPQFKKLFKKTFLEKFKFLLYIFLSFKLNNKIYQAVLLKISSSFYYKFSMFLLIQFVITYLKKKSK